MLNEFQAGKWMRVYSKLSRNYANEQNTVKLSLNKAIQMAKIRATKWIYIIGFEYSKKKIAKKNRKEKKWNEK